MPRIIPIRDLKNTAAISQMCNESTEPIYVTKNGYGDMVLMSMKAYEEKLMMLELYEKLAIAEEEVKNGKTKDGVAAKAAGKVPCIISRSLIVLTGSFPIFLNTCLFSFRIQQRRPHLLRKSYLCMKR